MKLITLRHHLDIGNLLKYPSVWEGDGVVATSNINGTKPSANAGKVEDFSRLGGDGCDWSRNSIVAVEKSDN